MCIRQYVLHDIIYEVDTVLTCIFGLTSDGTES